VAQIVFLLGAGFNCSILDPSRDSAAPLARNFFKVFLADRRNERLDGFRQHVYVDLLFEEIKRFWHVDLDGLRSEPFDIEECLTLFESQAADATNPDVRLRLQRASFALRQMLLTYLGNLSYGGHTPTARQFGSEVLTARADVLTFNYDTLAEESIASASGVGPKPMPPSMRNPMEERELADEDLDASHLLWKPALGLGFEFDEVTLPVAGVSQYVDGPRYYGHANNKLYEAARVLKLHGSIDWLRYTDQRRYPSFAEEPPRELRHGIVLDRSPSYWLGELPSRDVWQMEPIVIPPLLYKRFDQHPFPTVWQAALQTLSQCETLVVIGYSFPPTDFRTRRLFLEAFAQPHLTRLIVINPDPSVAGIARQLTHFRGAVTICDDLRALYGLPASWLDFARAPTAPGFVG
jgi:hypothetical protein